MHLSEETKKNILEAGKQGIEQAWEKSKNRTCLTWWERLIWVLLAGAAAIVSNLLTGCGHNVTITPDHTEICKNHTCLVLDKDNRSITYRQNAPVPPAIAEQAPVVNQEK